MQKEITKNTPLKKILELGEYCEKCGNCCMHSSGFVSKNEIKRLAKHFRLKEKDFIDKYLEKKKLFNNNVYKFKTMKKPFGPCIFYNKEKGCMIHKIKPLHCRIGNCNEHGEELSAWFTVNYLVNPTDPESIRQFKIYIDSKGKTLEGGKLKDLVKDPKLLKKILNYEVLK